MDKIKWFFSNLMSYAIAIARLLFWEVLLFFSGLQQILFTRTEICGLDLRGLPLRCDRDDVLDKISYVDKLKAENPDLDLMTDEDYEDFDEDNDQGEPE